MFFSGSKITWVFTVQNVKGLTHYQTTNFRLFQIERVCRQQFQIWQKWQKVIQKGRKYCGKRRNCSFRAISLFPTVFSKSLFPKVSLCGNGLIAGKKASVGVQMHSHLDKPLSLTIPAFSDTKEIGFWKTSWEKKKMLVASIFFFSHNVFFLI